MLLVTSFAEKNVYELETSPKITRKALADLMYEDDFFKDLDFNVDLSNGNCQIISNKDKNKSSIFFVITFYQDFDYNFLCNEFARLHKIIVKKYGQMVVGKQPPARPEWH